MSASHLHELIIPELIHDFQFKVQNGYLRQGVCPECKKKELFTSVEKPFVLRCGRENKCGAEFIVKELYPSFFENWSARYPKTENNPHAAADAYLTQARGLDISGLKGLYTEGSYHADGLGSATVCFTLPGGARWERIIDRPERFDRKAHFTGSYKGVWWSLPGQDLAAAKEIWLTEGIFDALSLAQNGITAVSLMSCHNYPHVSLHALREALSGKEMPLLVWALDNGQAGERAMLKFTERSRAAGWSATAARTSEGHGKYDWNDVHIKGRLTSADISRYKYYGSLLLAKSASDKALLIFGRTERHQFDFEHNSRLYWFKLDMERHMKAVARIQESDPHLTEHETSKKALRESGAVEEILNCYPTPLYFQKSEETDESWYYLRIDFPAGGQPVKATFTAGQLTTAGKFKDRVLSIAKGAMYTGTTLQLDKVLKRTLPHVKEVRTQNYIGYNKQYDVYVFNHFAVQNGRVYPLNAEDYFSLDRLDIKTLLTTPCLTVNTDPEAFTTEWVTDLWEAFGTKGFVTLAFWVGALFVEQIRTRLKTYPFLEITGEPGTGKSTLLDFMWRLCGREGFEGFDPVKNSVAGLARTLAQVSNLPVCLIEGDRNQENGKSRSFDWNELKNIYGGGLLRSVGRKGGSNDTENIEFRGAVVIGQNAPVTTGDTAIPERLIHISTNKSDHTAVSKAAAVRIERTPAEAVSGFLPRVLIHADRLLTDIFQRYEAAEKSLYADPEIHHTRIARNHAQMIALLEVLPSVIPVTGQQIEETRTFITELARQRVKAVQADPDDITEFWAMFDYLDSEDVYGVNHSSQEGVYAVNFNQLTQVASEKRQPFIDIVAVKKRLKQGKSRKFIRTKSIRSRVNAAFNAALPAGSVLKKPEVTECWIFEEETRS